MGLHLQGPAVQVGVGKHTPGKKAVLACTGKAPTQHEGPWKAPLKR